MKKLLETPIYSYSDSSLFLKTAWEEKRRQNPQFSLRAWSKALGMASHAPLQLILHGKRSVPKRYIPKLVQTLGLGPKEGLYLETLLEWEWARGPAQKNYYAARMDELRPKQVPKPIYIDHFELLKNPIHFVLREMTRLKDFSPDPQWIRKRVRVALTASEIQTILDRLIRLELLQKEPDGRLTCTHRDISTPPDVRNPAVQEYHKRVSTWAAAMVTEQTVQEREYNSHAFNIRPETLPLAKQMLRDFSSQLIAACAAPEGTGTLTYQFNGQFFAMTREDTPEFLSDSVRSKKNQVEKNKKEGKIK